MHTKMVLGKLKILREVRCANARIDIKQYLIGRH